MQLYEQYRPRQLSDVIGQDKIVRKIDRLRARGLAGRAYWLSGQSGTGKTTIALLIAAEIADQFGIVELDAKTLTPEQVQRMESDSWSRCIGSEGKTGRAYIVNESHGLKPATVKQLLTTLDVGRIPPHVCWIFTTTNEGQAFLFDKEDDAAPLISRCIELPLARRGLGEAFATRAQEIARAENLDGKPIKDYLRLVQDCRNNMRQVLQRIEAGEMCD